MKPKHFLAKLDEKRIVAAIAEAERKSSGEIRVYISHRRRHDALAAAHQRFLKLKMHKTRHRNAVLIYFAPLTHKFAIVGGAALHEKCGQNFWDEIAGQMSGLLKAGRFTDALLHAIDRVGQALAEHFPPRPDDTNELPDRIARD